MKIVSRVLAVVVALAMLATGPLAPLATAQQPAQTPPPPAPPMPQPAAPPQDLPEQESHLAEYTAYNVGAGIANVFYIPGKVLLCGLGGGVGIFILFISLGSAPKPAAYFAREGCGGKWILTGDDLRPDSEVRFDWERDSRY
ncbi:MAG: hypothetical protein DMD87_25155 [Candidatus Rokuibacteriota bacterium]|nr:MAG: hypothetical protein DMD87_25155 [Candidatus Rokubacteria bacterium]